MFYVNEYKVVFKRVWHDRRRPLSETLRKSKVVEMPETNGRYDTKCEIYVTQDNAVVGSNLELVYQKEPRFTGIARLHPNDTPDKVVGKKIALRKAIGVWFDYHKEWHYNCADFYKKGVRTAIWKAFWNWVADWPNPKPFVPNPRDEKIEAKLRDIRAELANEARSQQL